MYVRVKLIRLDLYGIITYNSLMKTTERLGRPTKGSVALTERVEMRMTKAEKQSFVEAAELAGLDLSSWVRMRLRQTARKELGDAERPVHFLIESRKN